MINEKEIIRGLMESKLKEPNKPLPIQCKIALVREVSRLERVLMRYNRVDKIDE